MKLLLLLVSVCLFCLTVKAQNTSPDLAGRKIITGSFNVNYRDQSGFSQTNASVNLLVGKIKANNTYLAFGGTFNYATDNVANPASGTIGPAIESGKFIKLIDKLYLTPRIGGSFGIAYGDSSGFYANIYASPIRFLYHFTDKFFLTAGFGGASISYSDIDDTTNFNVNGSLTNTADIGAFLTFKS